ncbi:MAG TPA: S41 family peptidase [Gemmataceae bacterium]|nr:S41 family peptidase [Gemmataceae bacterium]
MKRICICLATALLLACAGPGAAGDIPSARETIHLANHPALSPEGATLAFDWNGDIWTVPSAGGVARPLTAHPSRDQEPKFSPDGKEIAFISDREGSAQVFIMPAEGGVPRQVTFHTAGYTLQEWCSKGTQLLVSCTRDHFWRHGERFFTIDATQRKADALLFDDYGRDGSLSPDGRRLLFTREGPAWWRKGYHGSQASQIWLYDRDKKSFTKVLDDDRGCLWPLWKPDGTGFYYVGDKAKVGCCNLLEHDLETGRDRPLTAFQDDSVVFPCVSRDGSTIVFRHLFDLYRLRPGSDEAPRKIELLAATDRPRERTERRTLQSATQVAFTGDGLEMALIAGGDLWVMDTELREPRRVTATAEEEKFPLFAPDGDSLLFISDMKGQSDIWKAERADKQKPWFLNDSFRLTRLTEDGEAKSALTFSPDGSSIAYVRGRGELWVADADGRNARKVIPGWSLLEYDWSPDGKWLVYALDDDDFNRDIWIVPLDGSRKPYNVSRHPDNDHNPVWSPDGKAIAFTGRRNGRDMAIHYVYLRAEDEIDTRERTVQRALEKLSKARSPGSRRAAADNGAARETESSDPTRADRAAAGPRKASVPAVVIDFDRLHERVRHVVLQDPTGAGGPSLETPGRSLGLFWSPDSKKLAFTATIDGRRGTYSISIPDDLKPKLLTSQTGTQPRWLKPGTQIVWLGSSGIPASIALGPGGTPRGGTEPAAATPAATRGGGGGRGRGRGPATPAPMPAPAAAADPDSAAAGGGYSFTALQEVDLAKRRVAAFELCWRTMRDRWYDDRLGNRDWDAIRHKYTAMAAEAVDSEAFATVVQLMLGELNGSHLGFTPGAVRGGAGRRGGGNPAPESGPGWRATTAHLGVRFREDDPGPGLKIRDVLPNGPADQNRSRLKAGEVILSIDGTPVDPSMDLTTVLNGPQDRDVRLNVRGDDGKERDVLLRPISYTAARTLLYEAWLLNNRAKVEAASQGTLGYLHISAMSMPSFHRFEEELYSVGAGKEGLVIDVRENGGGSTADHLLTALTQPVHAITVPRGGGPGYPGDRKVYTTWNKPIVVLCNQNSFSNAEIFSHAIKTLKRGPLVGVPTAGGVVSTGSATIMDVGTLRLPFRGWFIVDSGEDMELNGAVPDYIVWPQPGEAAQGKDAQLTKAVDVLLAEVKAWKDRPKPALRKATQR